MSCCKLVSCVLLLGLGQLLAACGDDRGDREGVPFGDGGRGGGSARGGASGSGGQVPPLNDAGLGAETPPVFACPAIPIAYVLDSTDPFTMMPSTAGAQLSAAGFDVRPLPLDQDPAALRGLIVLTSFASESLIYREYVGRNSPQLLRFTQQGNVLLQLSQADQTEPAPPFLPTDRVARRNDEDLSRLFVVARQHRLLAGIMTKPDGFLTWEAPQVGWETFNAQGGFEVLLAGSPAGDRAALLEGAVGFGRVLLSAVPIDKAVGPQVEREQFTTAFFRNLHEYVGAVCQGTALAPRITPSKLLPGFSERSTMLALLPDTQIYSLDYPGVFTAQTSWIAANSKIRRIPYVLHLGDIVDQNSPLEWQHASQAMSQLDGVVPYVLATGNHDYGVFGTALTRDTLLNDYFAFERTAALPSFGGAFEPGKLDNTYHFLTVGGRDYVVISLEWGPRNSSIEWADRIMTEHPDRDGILITHAYLFSDSSRYDIRNKNQAWNPHQYNTAGGVNDGEELWQKLVRKHRFAMVFNGHVLNNGTGYLASVTDQGNTCHQMLSNYQFRNLGGEGYMRLVEFLEDGRTVRVYTYSPLYDKFLTEPDQNFTFALDPVGPRP